MFAHDQPNVVVFGDSNTTTFGPAWLAKLEQLGWAPEQLLLHPRPGSKPRHWLPRSHALYHDHFGPLLDRKLTRRKAAVHDALSPLTKLVIIGLGGNIYLGTKDHVANSALVQVVERLAPFARIVWRGPPPSTATRAGQVAPRGLRRGRYRKNAVLKHDLLPLRFVLLGDGVKPSQRRVYLDVLALHATGPAPKVRPLATGRDVDLADEQALVASIDDPLAADERAVRGPWTEFVTARDDLQSHVPKGPAAQLVEIAAQRGVLNVSKRAPKLPLQMSVVDPKALLRGGPPKYSTRKGQRLALGTRVLLERWEGRYGFVRDLASGEELGWTARMNLALTVQ